MVNVCVQYFSYRSVLSSEARVFVKGLKTMANFILLCGITYVSYCSESSLDLTFFFEERRLYGTFTGASYIPD